MQRLADCGDATGGTVWVINAHVMGDVSDELNGERGRQLSLQVVAVDGRAVAVAPQDGLQIFPAGGVRHVRELTGA
jgi:hypothetical protein